MLLLPVPHRAMVRRLLDNGVGLRVLLRLNSMEDPDMGLLLQANILLSRAATNRVATSKEATNKATSSLLRTNSRLLGTNTRARAMGTKRN